jgi:hypothetical protein
LNNINPAVSLRIRNQSEIDNITYDVVVNFVGSAIFDVNVYCRIRLEEPLEVRRQVMKADAVNCCHAHGARDDVFDLLQLMMQRVVTAYDLLAKVVKNLSFAREAELLLAALDKQRFEEAFQRTDLLAHG